MYAWAACASCPVPFRLKGVSLYRAPSVLGCRTKFNGQRQLQDQVQWLSDLMHSVALTFLVMCWQTYKLRDVSVLLAGHIQ